MIEFCGETEEFPAQPQCVSRLKLNFRRRNRPRKSSVAANATIANEINCCQPILKNIRRKQGLAMEKFGLPECVRPSREAGPLDAAKTEAQRFQTLAFGPWTLDSVAVARFSYMHRVSYAECTLGNHIYYSRYLDLLEAARGEFFRSLEMSFLKWQEQGTIFPVVECRVRYKTPARYDDVLKIEVWPTVVERVRLNFAYRILNAAGSVVLEAETLHVCTGLDEKPKRLPEELREKLQPLVEQSPA